ncbi:Expansin-B3 [Senna tora]|uniref:Expansin-B3 n=1 Tax=Senna tora TaxID=362788 RepID=A0A834SPU4_9FABA|nr:Expansin-B3 [Senna tora]
MSALASPLTAPTSTSVAPLLAALLTPAKTLNSGTVVNSQSSTEEYEDGDIASMHIQEGTPCSQDTVLATSEHAVFAGRRWWQDVGGGA